MSEPIRLAKRLAAQQGISRSAAEEYIAGGWVEVDGKVVDILRGKKDVAEAIVGDNPRIWI